MLTSIKFRYFSFKLRKFTLCFGNRIIGNDNLTEGSISLIQLQDTTLARLKLSALRAQLFKRKFLLRDIRLLLGDIR